MDFVAPLLSIVFAMLIACGLFALGLPNAIPLGSSIVYFQCTNDVELAEVSTRSLPGASRNAATATASSTKTMSPIDELRILIERGSRSRGY
jgi:hypothetical protein